MCKSEKQVLVYNQSILLSTRGTNIRISYFNFGNCTPSHTVKLLVVIIGVLGDMKASCKKEIEIISARRSNSLLCRIQKSA